VKKDPDTLDAELVVRKNRCGPAGENYSLLVGWEPQYQLFHTRGADGYTLLEEEDNE
jgi:hypothetical protein